MSQLLTPYKNVTLNVADINDTEHIATVCKALSVPERVTIMRSILSSSKNISMLSEELNLPMSSISRHIDILEQAGLVYFSYQPSQKGHFKFCTQAIKSFEIRLESEEIDDDNRPKYTIEMPLGMFSHCHIKAPCGMTGATEQLVGFDNPKIFFSPERCNAECIWFDSGFISYNFPTGFSPTSHFDEINFSFEICSETSYYNNHWPSDITIKINDVEILTFTSPGDFGGRRGKYTPKYWPLTSTQFGLLKRVKVNRTGSYLDDQLITDKITFDDLAIYNGNTIKLDIGIKADAVHKGGLNLFGKNFGDYPQSIVMSLK